MNFLTYLVNYYTALVTLLVILTLMIEQKGAVIAHRSASRTRQVARKAGLHIPIPDPHLPEDEQEQTDSY